MLQNMKNTLTTLKETADGLEGSIKFIDFECQLSIEASRVEGLTNSQKSCIQLGLEHKLSEQTLKAIIRYYEEMKDCIGECDLKLEIFNDITKYFKPIAYLIDAGNFHPYIRVHCECDWEEEHGLELVILDGKPIYVGSCANEHIGSIIKNKNEWNFA